MRIPKKPKAKAEPAASTARQVPAHTSGSRPRPPEEPKALGSMLATCAAALSTAAPRASLFLTAAQRVEQERAKARASGVLILFGREMNKPHTKARSRRGWTTKV